MYNGLKQGEYLKVRLDKTEKALDKTQSIVTEQKTVIAKQTEIISGQEKLISTNKFIADQNTEVKDSQIDRLNNDLKIQEIEARRNGRKKLWNGIIIGGVSVSVITTALIVFLK